MAESRIDAKTAARLAKLARIRVTLDDCRKAWSADEPLSYAIDQALTNVDALTEEISNAALIAWRSTRKAGSQSELAEFQCPAG
jgi:hypothetical protein